METFVTVLHIVVAFILITLVLLQDTKSGSVGGAFGGGGSSSVLGATGATTLAQNMTRWIAVVFAATSILLSVFSARTHKSVMDNLPTAAVPAPTVPQTAPEGVTPGSGTTTAPINASTTDKAMSPGAAAAGAAASEKPAPPSSAPAQK